MSNRRSAETVDASAPSPSEAPARGRRLPYPCPSHVEFRRAVWNFVSISTYLEDMRRRCAKMIGVSGPQWQILMAINDLDTGQGVAVVEVAAKMHAMANFVTTQSKLLEKRGLIERVSSTTDARVVLMSLSERAQEEMAKLFERWVGLHNFVFADFDTAAMQDLNTKLELLKKRTEAVSSRIASDSDA